MKGNQNALRTSCRQNNPHTIWKSGRCRRRNANPGPTGGRRLGALGFGAGRASGPCHDEAVCCLTLGLKVKLVRFRSKLGGFLPHN